MGINPTDPCLTVAELFVAAAGGFEAKARDERRVDFLDSSKE
jgi:hypothetical protein